MLNIILGALHDYAAAVLIVVFILAVAVTLIRIGGDLAAMEHRYYDRHETETNETVDANERKAA